AYELFAAMEMEAFGERARRELGATGEVVRRRGPESRDELTPQEEQIARLAGTGRTNPEIAAELFLSTRTVEWHLAKVYAKLGVASRRELHAAFAEATGHRGPRLTRTIPRSTVRSARGAESERDRPGVTGVGTGAMTSRESDHVEATSSSRALRQE